MEQARIKDVNKLYRAVAERLAEKAQDNVPETGRFKKYTIAGHFTGENIRGILGVEEAYQSDSARCVSLGVCCDGDDRMVSNFLFTGTKQEVLEWLESPKGQQVIVDTYIRLEEKLVHLLG